MSSADHAPDLNTEQSELIFGTANDAAEQAELKSFLDNALSDFSRQLDELAVAQHDMDETAGRHACHALQGSLRSVGLERAGLLLLDLEDHWSQRSPDTRAATIADARTSMGHAVDSLRAAYPWLA